MTQATCNGTPSDVNSKQAVPWWTSCRLSLALVSFLGYVNLYAMRINLSVAMVCMVNQTAVRDMSVPMATEAANHSTPSHGACPPIVRNGTAHKDGELVWDKGIQGLVLGSFFLGYIVTQVPGGWLASRFGGTRVIGYTMLVTSLATLLVPHAAGVSPYLLMALRIVTGLSQGVMVPAMSAMWARWAPPAERGKLMSISSSGMQIGNVVTLPLSGFLCAQGFAGGWPSIFYILGSSGVVWFAVWMVLIYDSPQQHKRISDVERDYIVSGIGATKSSPSNEVPWRALLTSRPLWALTCVHVSILWGIYTLLTHMPTFMREVLQADIKSNGLYSAVPYLAYTVMIMVAGVVADKLFALGMRVVNVRKICIILGALAPGLIMVGVGHITCGQQVWGVVLLAVTLAFSGFNLPGVLVNCVDLAPPFAGVIFGIVNTVGTLSGIVAPYVTARMTEHQSQQEWRSVFYLAGGVAAFGTIVFCVFAEGDIQPWARPYMYEGGMTTVEAGDKQTDLDHKPVNHVYINQLMVQKAIEEGAQEEKRKPQPEPRVEHEHYL